VNRVFRRRIGTPSRSQGFAYDVEQIFWSVNSVARLFPQPRKVGALYNRILDGSGPPFTGEWWRYTFRRLLFDRILITKTG